MKKNNIYITVIGFCAAITLTLGACKKDKTPVVAADPYTGVVFSVQGDQFGRPAINTVFVATADKDAFNATIPSAMGAAFQAKFQAKLQALNANAYTTNALGLDASTFTGVLATDVLNVSTTGKTTFFDGTNVLTGRALGDDVIDTELLLIFGGPDGTANAFLTSDHVNANDKAFLTNFPYLASPH